jgi:hypothetical protein
VLRCPLSSIADAETLRMFETHLLSVLATDVQKFMNSSVTSTNDRCALQILYFDEDVDEFALLDEVLFSV